MPTRATTHHNQFTPAGSVSSCVVALATGSAGKFTRATTMGRLVVLAGTTFERLTVVEEVERGRDSNGAPYRRFKCLCQCGNEIIAVLGQLRIGSTRSCGCLTTELHSKFMSGRNTTHGDSDSRTHRIWRAMKSRCSNPNTVNYAIYGGRGVTVCAEWRESYERFLADMGKCPGTEYSIDRFPDKNGPYAQGNCRWATSAEQNRNRRDTVMLTFAGKTMCLTDWAAEIGIKERTLRGRIKRYGWTVEEALTIPAGKNNRVAGGVSGDVPFDK